MRWATVERLRTIGWVVVTLLAIVAVVVLVARLFGHSTTPMRRVQPTITQIQLPPPPTPPPPPPPPKDEPQKPPEVQPREQQPTPQKPSAKAPPSKTPAAPPGTPLTSNGPAGNDAFGLAHGDGSGSIGGGPGGGDPFGYYDGVVSARVRQALQQNDKTRYGTYSIAIAIWVDAGGRIARAQLAGSTGDPARDDAITALLIGVPMGESAPAGWPQPRRLRIDARAPI